MPTTSASVAPTTAVDSAEDEATASEAATSQGSAVIVEGQTTQTQQVLALPDGTFQLTVDTVPVRVERDGGWVDIDTDLVETGAGFWAAEAATVPVEFGAGGSDVLARIQLPDGSWIASFDPDEPMSWVGTFNSRVQDPPASSLTAEYTVSFTDPAMYEAFRDTWKRDDSPWRFPDGSNTATLSYRRKRRGAR